MKKCLFTIFGPVLLAVIMVLAVFFSPIQFSDKNKTLWSKASSSMSANVIRGNAIKNEAIASGKYVPFFGSSELSRIDAFHPSVLAKKYRRGYTPFLLGAPGTQSLTQYMMIRSMGQELAGKKLVFIISPQWFVKDGVNKQYFDAYFSEIQTYQWALSLKKITPADQYFASRLTSYGKVKQRKNLSAMLAHIANGQLPTKQEKYWAEMIYRVLNREDELFSPLDILSKNHQINQAMHELPNEYNQEELTQLATKNGRQQTTNNPYNIDNQFFNQRLKKHVGALKQSQIHFDYQYSPEYSDFQLVLEQLASVHAKPLFIIPPVNKKWSEYTGLSLQMLEGFSKKITYQLKEQGFTNIADFTKDASVPYFMSDTIHLGWLGWLSADQYIRPFLTNKNDTKVTYHLSNEYFSTQWQDQNPATLDSK
ncbi:D-alanyl-lipoteichoic acid biosynthesis protein DltD [Enterococcus italicus]